MNSLFVSRIHPECTFFRPITMYLLSASRFTINTQSKSRIRRLFREFPEITMIHHLLRDFTRNPSFYLRIHYLFRDFTLIPFFLPNHYGLTICHAILLWIHYPFREITVNTLSISRIFFLYTICYADISLYSLSISLIHY